MSADAQQAEETPESRYPRGLYVHVIVVSLIGGFAVMAWFIVYEGLNKLIWDNSFVAGHVIKGAAGYGVALLLVMAVAKLALLSVGFKSGFLGGPNSPLVFASVSVALALNLVFTSMPIAILVAGIMSGAVYALFRTPLMVVLLTAFMLDASPNLIALIVLAVATVMIAAPPLQRIMAERQARRGVASD